MSNYYLCDTCNRRFLHEPNKPESKFYCPRYVYKSNKLPIGDNQQPKDVCKHYRPKTNEFTDN